jgi:hypothetical protein
MAEDNTKREPKPKIKIEDLPAKPTTADEENATKGGALTPGPVYEEPIGPSTARWIDNPK